MSLKSHSEGLALEPTALETLEGDQFILSTQLMKPKYTFHLFKTAHMIAWESLTFLYDHCDKHTQAFCFPEILQK